MSGVASMFALIHPPLKQWFITCVVCPTWCEIIMLVLHIDVFYVQADHDIIWH